MTNEVRGEPYPVTFDAEYPDQLSRVTTLFRMLLAIPVFSFLYLVQGNVVVAGWVAILVRGRWPRWLFDFQVGLNRFTHRAASYLTLITDKYPAFEGPWVVSYEAEFPEKTSRWKLLFWKLFAAVPHVIVLFVLSIAAGVVVFIAWWAILFTGRFPKGLHRFVVGVIRWNARVGAYVTSMTDAFPPFSLDAEARPGNNEALSAALGGVLAAGMVAAITLGVIAVVRYNGASDDVTVRYQAALDGTLQHDDAFEAMDRVAFNLDGGEDEFTSDLIAAPRGHRLVAFNVTMLFAPDGDGLGRGTFDQSTLRLKTTDGTQHAILVTTGGVVVNGPRRAAAGSALSAPLFAVFEISDDARVTELRAYTSISSGRHVAWKFEQ